MFSNLLDSIKGKFGSKSYWLGGLLPLFVWIVAQTILIHRHFPSLAAKWEALLSAEDKTFTYAAVTATLLALAYIMTSVSSVLLQALEAKIGPLRWIASSLYAAQHRALRRLNRRYSESGRALNLFRRRADGWIAELGRARTAGAGKPALGWMDWHERVWSFRLRGYSTVTWSFLHGARIRPARFRQALGEVARLLRSHDANRSPQLDRAHVQLIDVLAYAMDRAQFEKLRLDARRQLNYPGLRPTQENATRHPASNNVLAPTKFGNIGRTMRSYALTRYELDLDILWTRLQNSLQKEAAEYYGVLEDHRAMVDCMAALTWLTGVSTLAWTAALIMQVDHTTRRELLVIGLGGPLLTWIWYELACSTYRVFADVMRSSVDLFRFNLLKSLHLPLPYGSDEERAVWRSLGESVGFAEGKPVVFKHPS